MDEELKIARYNTAQAIYKQLKNIPVYLSVPEWHRANDYGVAIELYWSTHCRMPEEVESYCQAVTDAVEAVAERNMESYWQDTLDALKEL